MGVTSRPSTPVRHDWPTTDYPVFVAGVGPHPDPHTPCTTCGLHCSGCYTALGWPCPPPAGHPYPRKETP